MLAADSFDGANDNLLPDKGTFVRDGSVGSFLEVGGLWDVGDERGEGSLDLGGSDHWELTDNRLY